MVSLVKENTRITHNVYKMVIAVGQMQCNPGQFINVYLNDKSMLLPRPISICRCDIDDLTIVYRIAGKGTKHLSEYTAGSAIEISAPLGNGYMLDGDWHGKAVALVAGGIGIPPMVELAKALKQRGALVYGFLGFQSDTFLLEEMREFAENVMIATEDGSIGFKGNVIGLLSQNTMKFDEYFSCGPKPMLHALAAYCKQIEKPVQVSLEERMGCGFGACVGCACKIKEGDEVVQRSICKHGPVFYGKDVVWDE